MTTKIICSTQHKMDSSYSVEDGMRKLCLLHVELLLAKTTLADAPRDGIVSRIGATSGDTRAAAGRRDRRRVYLHSSACVQVIARYGATMPYGVSNESGGASRAVREQGRSLKRIGQSTESNRWMFTVPQDTAVSCKAPMALTEVEFDTYNRSSRQRPTLGVGNLRITALATKKSRECASRACLYTPSTPMKFPHRGPS